VSEDVVQVIASLKVNPDQLDAVEEYFSTMMPIAEKIGARVLQKIEIREPIVGGTEMETILQVEYPDRKSVSKVFDSVEYKQLIPVRDRAFLKYDVCIVGTDVMQDIMRQQAETVNVARS
jgi:uncharacterized protein (DUF1330 family)